MNVIQTNVAGADVVQAGDGPDLLLLHSLLAERSVFERALPDLVGDYRVTLPNLPGFGGTPPLELDNPTVADYAGNPKGKPIRAGGVCVRSLKTKMRSGARLSASKAKLAGWSLITKVTN